MMREWGFEGGMCESACGLDHGLRCLVFLRLNGFVPKLLSASVRRCLPTKAALGALRSFSVRLFGLYSLMRPPIACLRKRTCPSSYAWST